MLKGVSIAAQSANILAAIQASQLWTPVITFVTPGDLAVTYSGQAGSYVRMGRLVVASFNLATSSFTFTTASGNLLITGFPFVSTARAALAYGALEFQGIVLANFTNFTTRMGQSASTCTVVASAQGQSQGIIAAAQVPSGGTVVLRSTLCYETDAP